jgi:hypothetical protein
MIRPGAARRVATVLGIAAALAAIAAGILDREAIEARWWRFLLDRDPARLREFAAAPERPARTRAIREFAETAAGKEALLRCVLEAAGIGRPLLMMPGPFEQILFWFEDANLKIMQQHRRGGSQREWRLGEDAVAVLKRLTKMAAEVGYVRYVSPENPGFQFSLIIRKIGEKLDRSLDWVWLITRAELLDPDPASARP